MFIMHVLAHHLILNGNTKLEASDLGLVSGLFCEARILGLQSALRKIVTGQGRSHTFFSLFLLDQ